MGVWDRKELGRVQIKYLTIDEFTTAAMALDVLAHQMQSTTYAMVCMSYELKWSAYPRDTMRSPLSEALYWFGHP